MEVQLRHPSSLGDGKLSLASGKQDAISALHIDEGSDEDSGSDEPQAVPLKKNRLKSIKERSASVLKASALASASNGSSRRERDYVEDNQDEDDSSSQMAIHPRDGRVSTSINSRENSDTEGAGDGDEMNGINFKQEDSRKCFECDVCNMTFSNGANMRRHRMRHTGVKPYECRVCQKRFFRKDHLAEHMATHSKLLPFRCPICNKGFQRQIAMRAHFQNEHVGSSQDMVKACPLCSYKAGSMKSLRVHFRSRHGIDLDNPMPHSSTYQGPLSSTSSDSTSPGSHNNGEYSELAHALGFEDREKSDSVIPSHFLVPHIEISSKSAYASQYGFSADSSYNYSRDREERHSANRSDTPLTVSPQSDTGSNVPSSSDATVVIKKEYSDEHSSSQDRDRELKEVADTFHNTDDIQDMPEDLSSGNTNSSSPKCCSTSGSSLSPLKTLLDWKKESHQNGAFPDGQVSAGSHSRRGSTSQRNPTNFHTQTFEGDAISSSIGLEPNSAHSVYSRRSSTSYPSPLHQCAFCGIIFPDQTLYFLHKGCHSESNPWRCNICGELCSNVYDFNSHLLSKSHQ